MLIATKNKSNTIFLRAVRYDTSLGFVSVVPEHCNADGITRLNKTKDIMFSAQNMEDYALLESLGIQETPSAEIEAAWQKIITDREAEEVLLVNPGDNRDLIEEEEKEDEDE